MREEDQPPQQIWLDSEAIEEHFNAIRDKYNSNSGTSGDEDVPDPSWGQNTLTEGMR